MYSSIWLLVIWLTTYVDNHITRRGGLSMMGEEVFMANRKNYLSWSPKNRLLFSKLEFSAAPNCADPVIMVK